jgi:hypothetical protein
MTNPEGDLRNQSEWKISKGHHILLVRFSLRDPQSEQLRAALALTLAVIRENTTM